MAPLDDVLLTQAGAQEVTINVRLTLDIYLFLFVKDLSMSEFPV